MIFGTGPLPFLSVFAEGIVLGACYRLFSYLLKKIKAKKLFVHAFDFFFVLTSGVCYYFICFLTLDGKFRIFTVFGLIGGIAVESIISNAVKKAITQKRAKQK